MPDSPLASIIVNNYNYGRFLGEAIESALSQTYADTEVIVVDDGSTDDSRQVMESFGGRIKPVFKANGGQGSAYNAGLQVCSGEAVCFLDADDTLLPNAIETAVELLREPDIVKAQWPLRVVNAHGEWKGELSTTQEPPAGNLRDQLVAEGPLYDFHYTTGSAYCRRFLENVSPVPEAAYRNGADVYLITLAPAFGRLRTADQALGTYRAHGSNNYRERVLDAARIRNYIDRFEANASILHSHLAQQGVAVEPERWRRRNFNYLWPSRLLMACGDIQSAIPPGAKYALVDQDEWGLREPVAGRVAVPFMERDGEYWGPPSGGAEAVRELNRLRRQGVRFIAIWWTCFWWMDAYPEFTECLSRQHSCLVDNERLQIFGLSEPTADEPEEIPA